MKYCGNNYFNNECVIDYAQRSVAFNPIMRRVKGENSLFFFYLLHYTQWAGFFYLFAIWGVLLIIFTDYVKLFAYHTHFLTEIVVLMGICYFAPMILALPFFNEWYRVKVYPEMGSILYGMRMVLSSKRVFHKRTYAASQLSKKFTIFDDEFSNIMMKYSATGDVSRQLLRVSVICVTKYNQGLWYMVFEFKQKPKEGELEVKYQ